jgi:hypothetical protein
MTLLSIEGLYHQGTLGAKAQALPELELFIDVPELAPRFEKDGIVGLLADGKRNTMRSYLNVTLAWGCSS